MNKIKDVNHKYIIYLLLACLVILVIFYFKTFFTRGVYFLDTFLRKEVISTDTHYIGKNEYGDIHITVKGTKNTDKCAEVTYKLPYNITKVYTVNYKDSDDWYHGIENIKYKNEIVVSLGEFKGNGWILSDTNGKVIHDYLVINRLSPYDSDYEIPLHEVADLASFEEETIRGNVELLICALILLIITIVDIKYPLLYFTLKHFFSVKDPEPSEFYITMQKISWFVYPIIGIAIMLAAI